jgi:hypothetical protein
MHRRDNIMVGRVPKVVARQIVPPQSREIAKAARMSSARCKPMVVSQAEVPQVMVWVNDRTIIDHGREPLAPHTRHQSVEPQEALSIDFLSF